MNEIKVDIGPIIIELFKTQAYVLSFVDLLTVEQKDNFYKSFEKNFKDVVYEFNCLYPNIIVGDVDELFKK